MWQSAIELLSDYRFRDPLHQLVFDTLRAIRGAAPSDLRALLLQRLTLNGFPDVDVEPFFHLHAMSDDLAIAVIHRLKFSARLDQKPGLAGQL